MSNIDNGKCMTVINESSKTDITGHPIDTREHRGDCCVP